MGIKVLHVEQKKYVSPSVSSGWSPLITFRPLTVAGKKHLPQFGDRHSLLLLKRLMPTRVSFLRAYSGWRHSGAHEERELGAGRAFYRWLQKHELSILWREEDVSFHPLFHSPSSPRHDAHDEMAQNLSFAIRPVRVQGRNIKLYVEDRDMVSLLQLQYGNDCDFLELVKRYVAARFDWEVWRAPSPSFFDWTLASGVRPVFKENQLGFSVPKLFGTG